MSIKSDVVNVNFLINKNNIGPVVYKNEHDGTATFLDLNELLSSELGSPFVQESKTHGPFSIRFNEKNWLVLPNYYP